MTRFALAAALAATLAVPAFAQPSSGSNNTPQGAAVRSGEAGQVDRKPDLTPGTSTTQRQAPAAPSGTSTGPHTTGAPATPPASTGGGSGTSTGTGSR